MPSNTAAAPEGIAVAVYARYQNVNVGLIRPHAGRKCRDKIAGDDVIRYVSAGSRSTAVNFKILLASFGGAAFAAMPRQTFAFIGWWISDDTKVGSPRVRLIVRRLVMKMPPH
jgi:hypothetical protein